MKEDDQIKPSEAIFLPMDAKVEYIQFGKNIANELRIGNWLLYTPGPDNVEMLGDNADLLSALQKDGVQFEIGKVQVTSLEDGKVNGLPNNYFAPIPLTPEILEKCGFEIALIHLPFAKVLVPKSLPLQDKLHVALEQKTGPTFLYRPSNLKVKYLHQLQNLYFALTGTELEINL
jgi:hypothetical protein